MNNFPAAIIQQPAANSQSPKGPILVSMSREAKGKYSLYWWARTRPYPMVMLSGIMLVLSFPPFPFSFLAYFAFVPLLLVMDHTPDRVFEDRFLAAPKGLVITLTRLLIWPFQAIWAAIKGQPSPAFQPYQRKTISRYAQIFRYAYVTFLIWNVGCCYWLMLTALGVDTLGEKVQALSAGLTANLLNPVLMSIPIYLFARLRRANTSFWMSLSFVFFWLSFEWMHFHWELSWSWLTLGHSQTFYASYIQYIEYTGVLGISAHILLVNVVLYQMVRAWKLVAHKDALFKAGGALVLLILPFVLGIFITNENRSVFQSTGEVNIRLVQPNIDPYEKFGGNNKEQVASFAELISREGVDTIDIAILPETAIPRYVWRRMLRTDGLIRPLWEIIQRDSVAILTGLTETRQIDPTKETIPVSARPLGDGSRFFYEYYNAAALLRADTVPQTFQKGKLVPMVERMPYLEYASFLKNMNIDLGGSFGNYGKPPEMKPLRGPSNTAIASLICYESEYGDYIRPLMQKGANIMTVVTNDGWWNFDNNTNKRSGASGYIQHANLSVLRAIENRRELARSANTGTSMFVDVKGEIHNATPYWEKTITDRRCKLYEGETFYMKHGDYLGWLSLIISLVVFAYTFIKRARKKRD
ncbi:MAG: apolipoprotein N-acyltransferase [Bacteroidia bacterium]